MSIVEPKATPETSTAPAELDAARVEAFAGQVVTDVGTVLAGATMYIGYHTGLYTAMADAAFLTPDELAQRAGVHQRYVVEWLGAQAASGYIEYDPATGTCCIR